MSEERFDRIDSQLQELRDHSRHVDTQLADLSAGQAELRSDVTELRSDVTELRSDVTELRSDVTELRSDVTSLRGGHDDLRSGQAELRTAVEELKHHALQTDRWQAKADLRFDAHTAEIRDLKHQMLILHERVVDQFAALKGMDGPSWREFVAARAEDRAVFVRRIEPLELVVTEHSRAIERLAGKQR